MANKFVRKITNIADVNNEPFYTSEIGDLLIDKTGNCFIHTISQNKEVYREI